MPDKAYQTLRPLARIFPAFYRFRHKISDAKLEADRATVNTALDRIEQERQGRAYLVGDAFTVAHLTAAGPASTDCIAAAPRKSRGAPIASRSRFTRTVIACKPAGSTRNQKITSLVDVRRTHVQPVSLHTCRSTVPASKRM